MPLFKHLHIDGRTVRPPGKCKLRPEDVEMCTLPIVRAKDILAVSQVTAFQEQ